MVKEGGVQSFDAVDAVKVGVGGDDVGYAEAAHDCHVDKVAGTNSRVPVYETARKQNVFCVDRFYSASHGLSELTENSLTQ